MIPFRISSPLAWKGKTWMPGKETSLRMHGWKEADFALAIESGNIEPAIDGEVWYTGPWRLILRDQELYTVKQVRTAIVSNASIRNIGEHRQNQILDFLNKQSE